MAYLAKYTLQFTNDQDQEVRVDILKKNASIGTVAASYECTKLEINKDSTGSTKYDGIITHELILGIFCPPDDPNLEPITWESFINAEHDTWKVTVKVDGQFYFHGFLLPEEGNGIFQDKPYEVIIRATDNLTLLKDVALTDINGDNFTGEHSLIEYLAGAIKHSLLDLPIRVKCNYFHLAMLNRGNDLKWDMFQQTKLDYRTFQKDDNSFVSCYDAIKIILDKFCIFEYWMGMWVITNNAERQYVPGLSYYTDYDLNGANPLGFIDSSNYAQVGKSVDIYPINENQEISSRFALKSVKTTFNYVSRPEIPKNNKFDRGTEFETGTALDEYDQDGDGNTTEVIGTYKKYTIDDWIYGGWGGNPATLPALTATAELAYRKSTYNTFGVEIYREIILESSGAPQKFLQSEGMPVRAEDKIKIDFDFRTQNSGAGTKQILYIYIIPASGGARYVLDSQNTSQMTPFFWQNSSFSAVSKFYDTGENFDKYSSFSIESPPIPVNGTLYIVFQNNNVNNRYYYRNFNLEYSAFIAGGYRRVKGDLWLRSQNAIYLDTADDEVFISDTTKPMLKGTLLFNGQTTDPAWYRFHSVGNANPTNESKHFKELLNIARFNHSYRRFYAIEGDFNGLNYASENDQLVKYPIGFFKNYRFVDMPEPRDFVLVPPMNMDLWTGWVKSLFVEVNNPNTVELGTPESIGSLIMRLANQINTTAEVDWGGSAPASGTPGFPPTAGLYTFAPRTLIVQMDAGNNATATTNDDGVGNSPSITETSNATGGGFRIITYQIGLDFQIGNKFKITIYGIDKEETVQGSVSQPDGQQAGDSAIFKYIFE